MNKKVITVCLTLALATAMTCAVQAEEPTVTDIPEEIASVEEVSAEQANTEVIPNFYPTNIELRQDGEQMLIVKSYTVPAGTAIQDLKEDGVTRMGDEYTLWGVSENQGTTRIEEATLSKTVDVAVPSNIPEEAVASLQQDLLYDQDGYLGTLHLDTVSCGDTMREDGTYPASAVYNGTVSRVTDGDLTVDLIYAPVAKTPVEEPTEAPEFPVAAAAAGMLALLVICGAAGYALGKKSSAPVQPVKEAEDKPKVYVPANDIVVGAHEDDDDE